MDADSGRLDRFLAHYLRDLSRKIRVERAILFGSSVTGTVDPSRDVDVAVFSSDFSELSSVDAARILLRSARNLGEFCLDPIAFLPADLESGNPFVNEILRTGRDIPIS